jgi:HlyD family secretion protein
LTTIRVPVVQSEPRPGVGELNPEASTGQRKYTVLERKVNLNQVVDPRMPQPLFTLVRDLARVEVVALVPEADISRVALGQVAEFTVPAYPGREEKFQGTVSEIRKRPATEQGAVHYQVVLDVKNRRDKATGDWSLRPGMTATVEILTRKHANVWKVPSGAFGFQLAEKDQTADEKARLAAWKDRPDHEDWQAVWIVEDNEKPRLVFVRTGGTNARGEKGISDARYYEVLEWEPGLPPLDPQQPPRAITGVKEPAKSGLFTKFPSIKPPM